MNDAQIVELCTTIGYILAARGIWREPRTRTEARVLVYQSPAIVVLQYRPKSTLERCEVWQRGVVATGKPKKLFIGQRLLATGEVTVLGFQRGPWEEHLAEIAAMVASERAKTAAQRRSKLRVVA
ncbi:hypothetical protein [Bradyrhizobium zhanjiangense]|nr:hypothetical protein [Bradyrhizobium zhanjiangense]